MIAVMAILSAFILLLQVLHSTVVKQLEIAELLEEVRESKFHVSMRVKLYY